VIATWCPYSLGLKRLLNDPRVLPYAAHRRQIFVLERNEWETVARQYDDRVKSGEMTQLDVTDLIQGYKRQAGYAPLMDPSFLKGLHGQIVYWDAQQPIEYHGTPGLLVGPGLKFDCDVSCLLERMGVPETLADALVEKHYTHMEDRDRS
jgi:hypothetical protein